MMYAKVVPELPVIQESMAVKAKIPPKFEMYEETKEDLKTDQ